MGVSAGPNIIRDNSLVLELDAADRNSYMSGSTIWRDLTINNFTGNLINGPTFSSNNLGSILFDGVDDYVEVSNNSILNSTSGTISIWFKYTSIVGASGVASIIGKHDITQSRNGWIIFIDSSGVVGSQIKNNSQTTNLTPIPAYSPNTWNNITLTYTSGVSSELYGNAIQYSSGSCVSFAITSQPLRMVDSVDSFWGIMLGNISAVQIYNRVLSAQEIQQNYNALKSRFNY